MKRFGLIGKNISYSKSPIIHNLIADKLNHGLNYELISLKDENELLIYLNKLKVNEYQGFNITIPFKETIMKHLDVITDKAKRIGAVNTVYFKDNLLVGTNTDYDGFKIFLELRNIDLINKKIIILGSGGAAKALYHVFSDLGINPIIASIEKNITYPFSKIITWDKIDDLYDIYVNATPVGTYPNLDDSPINIDIVKKKIVLDVIYNPIQTKLMKHAKLSYNGYDMLIIQAIKSQLIWFDNNISINEQLVDEIKEKLIWIVLEHYLK